MGFERAKIVVKDATVGTGVKVSLAKVRGNTAKMKFSISESVAKTLGWSGGDKIEVLIGNGEHHGIIRFRKNNSVADAAEVVHRKANKGDYFQLSLGHQPAFIDRSEASRWCQFEKIEEGYVEIILPRWADETAPAKVRAPAPATPPASAPVARKAVTANLMGDPPPGRREMLAKVGAMAAE